MSLRKHVNNTDVAIEILKRFYVREKDLWKLKVRWWNVGKSHEPWCMNLEQKITVKSTDLANWELYL